MKESLKLAIYAHNCERAAELEQQIQEVEVDLGKAYRALAAAEDDVRRADELAEALTNDVARLSVYKMLHRLRIEEYKAKAVFNKLDKERLELELEFNKVEKAINDFLLEEELRD